MELRIADTFTDSLAKLNNDEQKAVKSTAFDLQLNPANPGMQFHRVDKAKDPNFWSGETMGTLLGFKVYSDGHGNFLLYYRGDAGFREILIKRQCPKDAKKI